VTGGEYAALAYGVVFVVVLAYVAIIAAKLQRLQRETAELLELARRNPTVREPGRSAVYAASVPRVSAGEEEAR
jgi:type II secretory pathway component PulM